MGTRTYAPRVMKFRRAVFAGRKLSPQTKVVLLRLADGMDAKAIVSVPRSRLAEELGVAPARITECIQAAKKHGYLSTVRRGRPGVTATYQGFAGSLGTESVPSHLVRPPGPSRGTDSVPHSEGHLVRQGSTQVVAATATNGTAPSGHLRIVSSDEEGSAG